MQESLELVIMEPDEKDMPFLELVGASDSLEIVAVVLEPESPLAGWFSQRGVEVASRLDSLKRLYPGQTLVFMGRGLPPRGVFTEASSRSLLLVTREHASMILGTAIAPEEAPAGAGELVRHLRRVLEDYFPASRHSTTSVKMAACLTEAVVAWHADGGVILRADRTGATLSVEALRGFDMPPGYSLKARGDLPVQSCFFSGKPVSVECATFEGTHVMPGVTAGSAVCVPVHGDSGVKGVLAIWSEDAKHSWDVTILHLFACYIAMIIEYDELEEKLADNLVLDPLTGLHNRREFDRRLHLEVERARRYTLDLSLVVFDIDNLEEYNASCGRMLGNLAVSDIAVILGNGTREVDFVARLGDDEFGLLLPETNRLGAVRLAERLREQVAVYPFPVPEDRASATLTVSAGVSSFPAAADSEEEMLVRAYRALADAQEQSNTVRLWEGGPGRD